MVVNVKECSRGAGRVYELQTISAGKIKAILG